MHIRIITMATLMAASMHLSAQDLEKNYKDTSSGNPISGSVFCADPTALDYKGRLYVYGSNDHQEFIKNGKKGSNTYGAIKSIVVFSTDDMVNWTFHGTIDVGKLCSSWGWRFGNSWAPSVTWRTTADGKEEFFLYFANGASNVGVLKANSPLGPWKSPLSKPMIDGDTPGVSPCKWCFDPGVVIDNNGVGWVTFGGGARNDNNSKSTNLQPNNACIVKLEDDMIHMDSKAIKIPAPYHFEANEMNIINGKYVYIYCTHFGAHDMWETYDKRGSYSAPGGGVMCYMVGDDPMHPEDWEYKGEFGPHPGTSGNNHSHLHKFQGEYYHIYHSGALLEAMKSAKATNGGDYRSICVNKATVNEETQKINRVTLNNSGVSAIKNLDPYALQQAETMATCGGVMYEDFRNVEPNTKVSSLSNDASENMYVKMKAGAWTMVRNASFGDEGARSFMFRIQGTGKLEIRFRKFDDPVAEMEFSADDWEDKVISVDPAVFKGKRNLYFVFTEAKKVQFDAWAFSHEDASGIVPIHTAEGEPKALFDLNGHRLTDGTPYRGVVIEQYQDASGKMRSRKRVSADPVH